EPASRPHQVGAPHQLPELRTDAARSARGAQMRRVRGLLPDHLGRARPPSGAIAGRDMSTEQASSLSRVPDERASAGADPGPRGGMLDWMFRTARVALGPGSRSARAGTLAPLARDTAGTPRSAAYERYLRALRRRTRSIQAWQLGVVVVFLILWEVAPRANWINPMLTSYPSAVARTFMAMLEDGSLAKHTAKIALVPIFYIW